jgi:hypothetical protein
LLTIRDLWMEFLRDGKWYGRDVRAGLLSDRTIEAAINHLQTTPDMYYLVPGTKGMIKVRLKEKEY